jgi:hypothetical protein
LPLPAALLTAGASDEEEAWFPLVTADRSWIGPDTNASGFEASMIGAEEADHTIGHPANRPSHTVPQSEQEHEFRPATMLWPQPAVI